MTVGISYVTPSDVELASQGLLLDPEVDAPRLVKLLNVKSMRAQRIQGDYAGISEPVNVARVIEHLRGNLTVAFDCLGHDGRACFGAFDIDDGFVKHAHLLVETVAHILGEKSKNGILITEGSNSQRGKVLILLRHPMHCDTLRAFMDRVVLKANLGAQVARRDIELFPKGGTGGLVRVGGRNLRAERGGELERLLRICDTPMSLNRVEKIDPVAICTLMRQTSAPSAKERRVISKLIATPWTWSDAGSTAEVFRRLQRIAGEVQRIRGPGELGRAAYRSILRDLSATSRDLGRPSPKTHDVRNPFDRELLEFGAWERPLGLANSFRPKSEFAPGVHPSAALLYEALARFVYEQGLSPSLFEIDLARICDLVGFSEKQIASRATKYAARAGILVVHDPGMPRTKGLPRLQGQYGLVGLDESQEDVLRCVLDNDNLRRRWEERRRFWERLSEGRPG